MSKKKVTKADAASAKRTKARAKSKKGDFDVTVIGDETHSSTSKTSKVADEAEIYEEQEQPARVWLPGMPLGDDEELLPDMHAYRLFKEARLEWPCLSFDVLNYACSLIGGDKSEATVECMTGTQAAEGGQNSLLRVKWSGMVVKEAVDSDSDKEEPEEEEGEEEDQNGQPQQDILASWNVPSGVNRVRCSNAIGAAWLSVGHVQVFDTRDLRPLGEIGHDGIEGFALGINSSSWVASGDVQGRLQVTDVVSGATLMDIKGTHSGASVEELTWSPCEPTVFSSSGSDGHVGIWDTRTPGTAPALWHRLHPCDVNAFAWNPLMTHLVATGSEDGTWCVWDLRMLLQAAKPGGLASVVKGFDPMAPLVKFDWHKGHPVSSMAWHPQDASVLAVASCTQDTVTLWDLAVERDPEQLLIDNERCSKAEVDVDKVPGQLLFIHALRDAKEVSWAGDLVVGTGSEGFCIFRSISI